MVRRRRRARARLLAAAFTVVAVACTGDDTEPVASTTSSPVEPAAAAKAVCGALRTWDNHVTEIANAAAHETTEATSDAARAAALLAGFDRLLETPDEFAAAVAELRLPEGDPWSTIRSELLAAPEAVRAELVDERADLAAVGPISADDERGRVSQFFNAVEKSLSLVEPRTHRSPDAELRAAFRDEPECRHVVQSGQ